MRGCLREPRLADAARPDHGDDVMLGKQIEQRRHIAFAPEDRLGGDRKVRVSAASTRHVIGPVGAARPPEGADSPLGGQRTK
jgi:hypothetical protein